MKKQEKQNKRGREKMTEKKRKPPEGKEQTGIVKQICSYFSRLGKKSRRNLPGRTNRADAALPNRNCR